MYNIVPVSTYYVRDMEVYHIIQPDPALKVGDKVLYDGEVRKVVAIESFLVPGGQAPGKPIGLLLNQV